MINLICFLQITGGTWKMMAHSHKYILCYREQTVPKVNDSEDKDLLMQRTRGKNYWGNKQGESKELIRQTE